jgi:hypothetical protein
MHALMPDSGWLSVNGLDMLRAVDPVSEILTQAGIVPSELPVVVDYGDGHPVTLIALGGAPAVDLYRPLRAAFDVTGT